MAMTPEAKVKKQIRAILERTKVYFAMPMGTGYGNSGVPDFLCCAGGRFLAIEAKAGKGRPTALQLKNLDDIAAAGGMPLIINEENLHMLEPTIENLRTCEQK